MKEAIPPWPPNAVVQNIRARGRKPIVAAVSVHAGEVREILRMASEIHLVIDLGESAKAGIKLALLVTLEAGARDYIEYTIAAIAISRRVSATLSLYVVNIFRIDLRADIAGDVGLGMGTPSIAHVT
jgi:hypothetical protein